MPPPESARISTCRRRCRGSCASASRVTSIWSAAVSDPALPGRSMMASGSPPPSGPWSANAVSGWKPKVFFQVGAACSFSECAITIVASMSTGISAPPAPGAACPASSRARSRAAARAARIAFSARGASAARLADQAGDHRVGGHRPEQLRLRPQHATSARQSPPSASVTARSAMIFPGS